MYKYAILFLALVLSACTDQDDPVAYTFKNTASQPFEVFLFENSTIARSAEISLNESMELDVDKSPFDGPFATMDSIKLIFEDGKQLTYVPLSSNDDCLSAEKNPFCPHSDYQCTENNCTFIVDSIEYGKAQ